MNRANRVVQSGGGFERHIGGRAQTNEFDHALGSGELVGGLAARADLGSAPASGDGGNTLRTTGQRNLEIGR